MNERISNNPQEDGPGNGSRVSRRAAIQSVLSAGATAGISNLSLAQGANPELQELKIPSAKEMRKIVESIVDTRFNELKRDKKNEDINPTIIDSEIQETIRSGLFGGQQLDLARSLSTKAEEVLTGYWIQKYDRLKVGKDATHDAIVEDIEKRRSLIKKMYNDHRDALDVFLSAQREGVSQFVKYHWNKRWASMETNDMTRSIKEAANESSFSADRADTIFNVMNRAALAVARVNDSMNKLYGEKISPIEKLFNVKR